MNRILKIDGVRNISGNNSDYTVYIFNNDKVVRVNSDTGEVITKNVPEAYLNLISVYSATESAKKNSASNKESDTDEEMINEKIQYIMSGSGAGARCISRIYKLSYHYRTFYCSCFCLYIL